MVNIQVSKLKFICSWFVVLLSLLAIFTLSSQPAAVSNGASKSIVKKAVEMVIELTKAEVAEPDKSAIINKINNIAREYMHGVVFFVLGILTYIAVILSGSKGMRAVLITLAICVIYGIVDEVHQTFIPGRAFQLSDMLMDTTGSIIGVAVMWIGRGCMRIKLNQSSR